MNKWIRFVVLFAIASFAQHNARALVITPIGGSTSSPIIYGTSVNNVIDGVLNYDSYLSLGTVGYGTFVPRSVLFNLGGAYDLTAMNLWNNAGSIFNDGEGIKAFSLSFFDNSMAALGSFSANAADILAKQTFSVSAANVAFVDLVINSNHSPAPGDSARGYVDFYEINFEGTRSIPANEPAAWVLMSAGFFCLVALRRRWHA